MLFVAAYLLADVRKVKATYLKASPKRYRRDARELWEAFGVSLSRYLGGLLFVVVIQGVLAGLALWVLGVPYAILLGAWVSLTAIIPYLGAFLGGIPAVIVALIFESPTTAVLTVVAYVLIQQLEGNFLTPRIQGQALHVHPIIVLLAVIGGGQLAGLAGVIFAVPTLAVFRVFFDFFRARIRMDTRLTP
jgi:predicted PurR-regulated permease PerM